VGGVSPPNEVGGVSPPNEVGGVSPPNEVGGVSPPKSLPQSGVERIMEYIASFCDHVL